MWDLVFGVIDVSDCERAYQKAQKQGDTSLVFISVDVTSTVMVHGTATVIFHGTENSKGIAQNNNTSLENNGC